MKMLHSIYHMRLYLPVLLCFFIPLSTSLTTVCMFTLLGIWLLGGDYKAKLNQYWMHPLAPYLLAIIGWTLLLCPTSYGDFAEVNERIKDALRLGFIPIIGYYLTSKRHVHYCLYAFVLAMVVTLLASFAKVGLSVPIGQKYTEAAVFKSHIDTNFFMSVAAFYVFYLALANKKFRKSLAVLGLMMVYYVFFMSMGRIGYLTLFVIGLYGAHYFYGKKGLLISTVLVFLVGLGVYEFSEIFQQRLNALVQDWELYKQGQLIQSSLGSRIQFYLSSLELIAQKPWIGWGPGSFGAAYLSLSQGNYLFTDNPHNEFLRFGVELGLIGVGLFSLLLVRQWQIYAHVDSPLRLLFRGTLLLFVVGCMLNSWLIDFSQSYFFVIFSAFSLYDYKIYKPGELIHVPLH